jgi:hypothetical protein
VKFSFGVARFRLTTRAVDVEITEFVANVTTGAAFAGLTIRIAAAKLPE